MRIDLNADLGEGHEDRSLLRFVTSVNVACGGHAGDERSMAETVAAALDSGAAVGAHPSYPDREGFGRRELELPPAELAAAIEAQLAALTRVARPLGARLGHVKPHGALYNRAARDPQVAAVVARAVAAFDRSLRLVGLAGSALLAAGRAAGLAVAGEGFADRRYAPDGSLVSRRTAGAILHDPREAAEQALAIASRRTVVAADGTRVAVLAETLCVHGDTDGAVAIARAVRERLEAAGVTVAPL